MSLPSWELLSEPELLQAWAMNLMVINVSTRKYARAVRLPDDAGGDLPAASGDATSKSAVSRRFVALTRSKLKAWLASPLDDLDLVVLQIDGLHVGDHLMVAAIGIDTGGAKHVLGLAEGATENTATVQALLDNPIARGLDAERPRLYILDGAKALLQWFGERDGLPCGPPVEVVSGRGGIGLRAANRCKPYSAGKVETCHERIAEGCEFTTPA